MRRRRGLAVLAAAALAGCGGEGHSTASGAATVASTAVRCPVTHPNGRTPPGERPNASFYATAGLWTLLPAHGAAHITSTIPLPPGATLGIVRADGSLTTKFPWWGSTTASARLSIRGMRLDRRAPQLRVTVLPGSSARSPQFWPTRLRFATAGCWRVDARSGRAHLSFVLFVDAASS